MSVRLQLCELLENGIVCFAFIYLICFPEWAWIIHCGGKKSSLTECAHGLVMVQIFTHTVFVIYEQS